MADQENALKSTLQPRPTEGIQVLRLALKNGRHQMWTIEQALMPHNFKQLTENCQKMLTDGKTGYQKLKEDGHI